MYRLRPIQLGSSRTRIFVPKAKVAGSMVGKNFTALEKEIVILSAVWELIDEMVHYGHFVKEHETQNATLMFENSVCSKHFLVILSDFLSLPKEGAFGLPKPKGEGSIGDTYLGLLINVAENSILGCQPELLIEPARAFSEWLDAEALVEKVWMPSIDIETDLRVRRRTFLKICGSISKHSITRSDHPVKEIEKVLNFNGVKVQEGEAYLAIPDFRTWFQRHVFMYHTTSIAAFLNNIRWGIFDYLAPEYARSYRKTHNIGGSQHMYEYDVPAEVRNSLTRSMYWDIMNKVRTPPYFPRFTVNPSLTGQF